MGAFVPMVFSLENNLDVAYVVSLTCLRDLNVIYIFKAILRIYTYIFCCSWFDFFFYKTRWFIFRKS